MNTPKLSIVIPVYNVVNYISLCIESIENSKDTLNNLEIILVDDGSNDGSELLCDKYASQNDHIKVFHKQNGGVSTARNVGINNASGDYIWFVDPDDSVETDCIQSIINTISANEADVYEFDFYRNDEKTSLAQGSFFRRGRDIMRFFLKSPKFHLWNKVIKRETIGDVRFIKGIKFGEDFLFLAIIMNKANDYRYINTPIYRYIDGRTGSAMTAATTQEVYSQIDKAFFWIKANKTVFSNSNFTAIPAVFINIHKLNSRTPLPQNLVQIVKRSSIEEILKANCSIKQKAYLIMLKLTY